MKVQPIRIQDLEGMNLKEFLLEDLRAWKSKLHESYYHTKHGEMTGDGRCLKDVIGEQMERITNEILARTVYSK